MGMIPLFIVATSLVASVAFARGSRPKRSLRWLYITIAVLVFVWAILCVRVYPRYVFPE
jgi:uncharacterized membrane protein